MQLRRSTVIMVLVGLLAAGALGCARVLYNFGSVEPERIYRAAQPSPLLLRWVLQRHGIRSIVNLRGRTPGFESAFAAQHGLKLFALGLSASRQPTKAEVERFLALITNPENQPVLVHCRSGVDRTGYMLGVYRVSKEGWDKTRAVREMNRHLQFEWANPLPQQVVKEGARSP